MKLTKKEREELAKRFNISLPTFYNWEKTKPDLIYIIELGLEKEKEIEEDNKITEKNFELAEKVLPMIKKLEKELEEIREKIKK